MAVKENVINLTVRRQKEIAGERKVTRPQTTSPAPVVDMTGRRDEILQDERRKVRRTILSEFIGVHVLVPNHGLMSVTLYDISGGGLSFDVPGDKGRFRAGEEVAMRVYLNHKTYFSFVIKITNVRPQTDEPVIRHGANFVKGTVNEEALSHFVKFIETVSASLQTDGGDVTVNKLTGSR
ncbi:MAG: PilZ domain-containing protein [Bdellovibrionales bacterium]